MNRSPETAECHEETLVNLHKTISEVTHLQGVAHMQWALSMQESGTWFSIFMTPPPILLPWNPAQKSNSCRGDQRLILCDRTQQRIRCSVQLQHMGSRHSCEAYVPGCCFCIRIARQPARRRWRCMACHPLYIVRSRVLLRWSLTLSLWRCFLHAQDCAGVQSCDGCAEKFNK